jgi:hypothetical protein
MNSQAVEKVLEVAEQLREQRGQLGACVESLESILEARPDTDHVWDRDLRGELVTNDDCPGVLAGGWWVRDLAQIDGVTIHHTLSGSPHAMARYYIHKGGGRPSIPYTVWVTEVGEVLLCNDLTAGCWHDHTGHRNTHLSIGMAGRLHIHRPADVQMDAVARVAVWAINHEEMSVVRDGVRGHCDYHDTECPGWGDGDSGRWKLALFNRIYERL